MSIYQHPEYMATYIREWKKHRRRVLLQRAKRVAIFAVLCGAYLVGCSQW